MAGKTGFPSQKKNLSTFCILKMSWISFIYKRFSVKIDAFFAQRFRPLEKAEIGHFVIFSIIFNKMLVKKGGKVNFCMKSSKLVNFFRLFFTFCTVFQCLTQKTTKNHKIDHKKSNNYEISSKSTKMLEKTSILRLGSRKIDVFSSIFVDFDDIGVVFLLFH